MGSQSTDQKMKKKKEGKLNENCWKNFKKGKIEKSEMCDWMFIPIKMRNI